MWTTGVLSNQQPSSVQWLEQLKITPIVLRIGISEAVEGSLGVFIDALYAGLGKFKTQFVVWRKRSRKTEKPSLRLESGPFFTPRKQMPDKQPSDDRVWRYTN